MLCIKLLYLIIHTIVAELSLLKSCEIVIFGNVSLLQKRGQNIQSSRIIIIKQTQNAIFLPFRILDKVLSIFISMTITSIQ